jgi:hypothetical protein
LYLDADSIAGFKLSQSAEQITNKMHSSLVRIQNVFGFFTTVAFSLGMLIALSVVASHQNPSAELELRNVQV